MAAGLTPIFVLTPRATVVNFATANTARATLEHDEGGEGFTVEHNESCPAINRHQHKPYCACGLASLIENLSAADEALLHVRDELKRLAKAVA